MLPAAISRRKGQLGTLKKSKYLLSKDTGGFKGKVGGLSLSEDIARMEIRDVIGEQNNLMVDVNEA